MRRRLGMPLLLVESSLDTPEICGLSNVLALLDDDVAEHAAPAVSMSLLPWDDIFADQLATDIIVEQRH